jgi:hypothetical protein
MWMLARLVLWFALRIYRLNGLTFEGVLWITSRTRQACIRRKNADYPPQEGNVF